MLKKISADIPEEFIKHKNLYNVTWTKLIGLGIQKLQEQDEGLDVIKLTENIAKLQMRLIETENRLSMLEMKQ